MEQHVENELLQELPAPPVEVKRGRGRPPGGGKKAVESSTPPTASSADDTGVKKRGRPSKPVDKGALAKQLMFGHAVAASITKLPDLALDQGEAQILAEAITTLMEEYDIALSGKSAALLGMAGAVAIVYGPRIMLIAEQAKKNKAERKARQAQQTQAQMHVVQETAA